MWFWNITKVHKSVCCIILTVKEFFLPYFDSVKDKVQTDDKSLYRSFLGISYQVLEVLSANDNWNRNVPIGFNEFLVKIENLI